MSAPTRSSVLQAIKEFSQVGCGAFLDQYSSGRPPKAHYLAIDGKLYPLKAIWAASHKPAVHTSEFNTAVARRGLEMLGFVTFVDGALAEQYLEGVRSAREVEVLSRNSALVAEAKSHHGLNCKVCGFNFEERYGSLGVGYIECHHIVPLSSQDGEGAPTSLSEVTVLCANCHRMIHRRRPVLTLEELKSAIEKSN